MPEYIVFISGEEHRCPAGSFIWVPAGLKHGFRVGATQSRKLNIYVLAAMEGVFETLTEATTTGTVTSEAALADLASRHAMGVTGPVPQRYV